MKFLASWLELKEDYTVKAKKEMENWKIYAACNL